MAKYTMEQKREAVRLYTIMGKEGTCYFNNEAIHNIRALCKALNISSQSLYRWAELIELFNEDTLERKEDDLITEDSYTYEVIKEYEAMTFKMGTTFFQTMAQGLGIQNYRMPLKQLYLTIGNELIKRSGLVDNGVRKELRLE